MSHVKASPCCARLGARLIMDQANLQRLAQRVAARSARGDSVVKLVERIEDSKRDIAGAKQAIVDHEADHAGGGL